MTTKTTTIIIIVRIAFDGFVAVGRPVEGRGYTHTIVETIRIVNTTLLLLLLLLLNYLFIYLFLANRPFAVIILLWIITIFGRYLYMDTPEYNMKTAWLFTITIVIVVFAIAKIGFGPSEWVIRNALDLSSAQSAAAAAAVNAGNCGRTCVQCAL